MLRLRELIRDIRACKTQAEETGLFSRERASIRQSFLNNEEENRPRNIAKLVYINMNGYDTDFGQMECLKLITSEDYMDKKIGYLGLTQLFNEKSEVLMLATNRMRFDLESEIMYIQALALVALSEICTEDMCRCLSGSVNQLMASSTNNYIKKKATLAATRIIRKVPEALDQFETQIGHLIQDKNHGVLLSVIGFMQEALIINPDFKEKFKQYIQPLVKVLKGLLSSYSQEYDVTGTSDPFLQVEILKFFKIIAQNDRKTSDEVSDILAQVVSNSQTNKNAGNAVLFECVKTISSIQSATTLRTLGINALAKFLSFKDSNSKYVSIYSLQKVVKYDFNAVSKQKTLILDCFKENDISIKKKALELIQIITNQNNVEEITRDMLQNLDTTDQDFKRDITSAICSNVERFSPNIQWHIDTIINVLLKSGNYVSEESISQLINLITVSPQIQVYVISKIYFALQENLNQEGLALIGLWSIGEFGYFLINGNAIDSNQNKVNLSSSQVISLIQKINNKYPNSQLVQEYMSTCLIKLYVKYRECTQQIIQILKEQSLSSHIEVQQRACEFLHILQNNNWSEQDRLGILEKMPAFHNILQYSQNQLVNSEILKNNQGNPLYQLNNNSNIQQISTNNFSQQQIDNKNDLLIDIDDVLNIKSDNNNNSTKQYQNQIAPQQQQQANITNLLDDIFGGNDLLGDNNQNANNNNQSNNLMGLYDQQQLQNALQKNNIQQSNNVQDLIDQNRDSISPNINNAQEQQKKSFNKINQQEQRQNSQNNNQQISFVGFEDQCIQIVFSGQKQSHDSSLIMTSFTNKTSQDIQNLVFQAAVLKHLKLKMNQITGNMIPANSVGQVTQTMNITNTLQGQKGITIKLKCTYTIQGNNITQEKVINFPENF